MNCNKAHNYFLSTLESSIHTQDLKNFKQHLNQCPQCAKEYKLMAEVNSYIDNFQKHTPVISPFFTGIVLSKIENIQTDREEFFVWDWISEVLFKQKQVVFASILSVFIGAGLGLLIASNIVNKNITSTLEIQQNSDEEIYWASLSDKYLEEFLFVNNK